MAISNFKNEPKRESIESGIGILTVVILLPLYLWLCHRFVIWVGGTGPQDYIPAHIFTILFGWIVLGVFLTGLYWFVVYFTHEVGEFVCAVLKSLGLDPRPRNRPGRRYDSEKGYYVETKESW